MNKDKEIADLLYKRFGTDSGILFGIKERSVVEMIINMTIEQVEKDNPEQFSREDMDECWADGFESAYQHFVNSGPFTTFEQFMTEYKKPIPRISNLKTE